MRLSGNILRAWGVDPMTYLLFQLRAFDFDLCGVFVMV